MAQAAPGDERLREALLELDAITRRLRRECPWDREQDERSIVPHTVEEAYELADAAHSGDDAKLLDELGDVLFQVYFLSLLLEERGAGDLAAVAAATTRKLVRRHPHIFGEDEPRSRTCPPTRARRGEVKQNWDAIKLREGGGGEVAGRPARADLCAQGARRASRARATRRRRSPACGARAMPSTAAAAVATTAPTELYEAVGELLLAVVEAADGAARRPRDRAAARGDAAVRGRRSRT